MQTDPNDDKAVSDEILAAYIDGELDETARIEVEAYVARNPKAAEYVEQAARLRANLHRLFDYQLDVPLPPHHAELAKELEQFTSYGEPRRSRSRILAAGVAALVLLGFTGLGWHYLSSDITGQRMFALFERQAPAAGSAAGQAEEQQAAGAQRVAARQPSAPTQGEEPAEEQLGAAVEQTPATAVNAPDFSSFGFDLVGTRLLAKQDDRSMQLIYESSEGARVELFYTGSSGSSKSSLTLMEEGPISVLFWHNAGRSYSLIGEVDRNTLLEIGKVVNGEWTVPVPSEQGPAGGEKKQSSEDVGAAPANTDDPGAEAQDNLGEAPLEDGTIMPRELVPDEVETEKQT